MKKMWNLIRQDIANAQRDNLAIYVFVAPILVSIFLKLFLPSAGTIEARFAVGEEVSQSILSGLRSYGRVETYSTKDAILERVERPDDAVGLLMEGDQLRVVLEGNEPEGESIAVMVISDLFRAERIADYTVTKITTDSLILEYGAVMMVMMAIMVSAMIAAFNMIYDKESDTIRAISISPMRFVEYFGARAIFMFIFSFVLLISSQLIMMGGKIDYFALILAFLGAFPLMMLLGFIVGGFAENQLQAGAIIKVVMFIFLSLPMASIFLPQKWQVFLYWLPNYWMFKSFEMVIVGTPGPVAFGWVVLFSLIGGLILLGVLFPIVKKRYHTLK